MPLPGWVDLILGRFGDPGGPATPAEELTLDEIESLIRALRIGSYSQSTLAGPLGELEAGLELLRARVGVSVEDSLSAHFGLW